MGGEGRRTESVCPEPLEAKMAGPKNPGTVPASSLLTIRVDGEDYLAVARAAEHENRSIAGYVRHVLRQHLAEAA